MATVGHGTTWTPGPWKVHLPDSIDADIRIRAQKGEVAEAFAPFRSPDDGGFDAFEAEAKANANLIASAPALFSALAQILAEESECAQQWFRPTTLRAARGALARARGETP